MAKFRGGIRRSSSGPILLHSVSRTPLAPLPPTSSQPRYSAPKNTPRQQSSATKLQAQGVGAGSNSDSWPNQSHGPSSHSSGRYTILFLLWIVPAKFHTVGHQLGRHEDIVKRQAAQRINPIITISRGRGRGRQREIHPRRGPATALSLLPCRIVSHHSRKLSLQVCSAALVTVRPRLKPPPP